MAKNKEKVAPKGKDGKDSKDKKKKKKGVEQQQQKEAAAKRFPKIIKRRQQVAKGVHGGMKLLLIEDVRHVGSQGDVVEVKPGYGRNFLIPQGLATFVNPETLVRIEKHKQKVEALKLAKIADLKVMAKKLENMSISIHANANEEGHLYGSVNAVDISAALKKENMPLEEDNVRLEGPLKELGLYHVKLHLAEEVETEIKVWVVPTDGKAS